ncbi:beta-1,4-galactosyltransferase 4-like [Triplophysa rosa]|uniref:beta-1,4-galactosyltransferase 4-like n=1 Tax=Triplophysa rosa TaxID=992332 RepID=UPI002545FD6A|nr:beta-1,4-galactosyltransferase 4-like [Triplophysa rosa]XP_057213185.1 beta-1,4-galactosyltransferase 4-like [Triplophysa rosa]
MTNHRSPLRSHGTPGLLEMISSLDYTSCCTITSHNDTRSGLQNESLNQRRYQAWRSRPLKRAVRSVPPSSAGDVRFNRAKLLNVGYLKALKDYNWDCFIHHDVDLIPENDQNLYVCEEQPKHPAVGRNSTGYKLRYKGYFGGVSAMTVDQFHQVNGFPNTYWGGEDDDLRILIQLQKMTIVCTPAEVARYTMVFHKRDSGYQVNKDS